MHPGLESETTKNVLNEAIKNLSLVRNINNFNKIQSLYHFNEYYNQVLKHKLSNNMYLQLSINKTELMLNYFKYIRVNSNLLSKYEKDLDSIQSNFEQANKTSAPFETIYRKFIGNNDMDADSFLNDLEDKVNKILEDTITESQKIDTIKLELRDCQIFSKVKKEEYKFGINEFSNQAATSSLSRIGKGPEIYAQFLRKLKLEIYPYKNLTALIFKLKDKIQEHNRTLIRNIFEKIGEDKFIGFFSKQVDLIFKK